MNCASSALGNSIYNFFSGTLFGRALIITQLHAKLFSCHIFSKFNSPSTEEAVGQDIVSKTLWHQMMMMRFPLLIPTCSSRIIFPRSPKFSSLHSLLLKTMYRIITVRTFVCCTLLSNFCFATSFSVCMCVYVSQRWRPKNKASSLNYLSFFWCCCFSATESVVAS